jgi:phospholipid/cholesterol/gamma-HCH transport system ATP-binding protein
MAHPQDMIRLDNVTFAYEYGDPVLRDVSFRIPEGESRVIMGQSGSGKSTILKLLLGLYQPASGEVYIDDEPISECSERRLESVRKKMGMVFQDGALFDSLTVGENVGFYLIEHEDLTIEEVEERVRQILRIVRLEESLLDRMPEELSGGMQRRVAIARALLATAPKIMLYDEPTTGLDPESATQVLRLMDQLTRERNIATIVVTHQFLDALAIADKFILIDKGQVAFDGSLADLKDSEDKRVTSFLEPFRASLRLMEERRFV